MKRITTTLFFTAATCAAYSQTAFPTGITSYVYVGASGPNASTDPLMLYTSTNVAGSSFTNAVTVTGVSGKVNGLGLSKTDGFLYGLGFQQAAATSAGFYRMGSDGVTQQTGIIPPPLVPGSTVALINTTAGMIDAADNYYFTAYTYSGNPFATPYSASSFRFFLCVIPGVSSLANGSTASLSPVYHEIDISNPDIQTAFQSFLTNFDYVNPGYSDGGVEDIAISPVDGKIYSYMSYPDAGNGNALVGRPVVIDPATLAAAPVGSTINTTPGFEIAGAYFSSANNYYVLFTDGSYTQVDLTTGAIGTLMATNLPLQSGTLRGDLASDPLISPLPLTLLSFSGKVTGNGNLLEWASGTEQNVKGFTLQRSTDGKNYETIAWLDAKGNNSRYSFTDSKPYPVSYYRFRTEDNDGKWQYSNVLRLASSSYNDKVLVYPTIVHNNSLNIETVATGIHVTITGVAGNVIADHVYTSGAGTYTITLPQVSPGIYVVHVADQENGSILAVQKIITE